MVSDAWGNVEKTGDPFGTTYCLNRSKHDEISGALGIRELSRNRFERQLPASLGRHVVCGNRKPTKLTARDIVCWSRYQKCCGAMLAKSSSELTKKALARCRTLEVIHVDETMPVMKSAPEEA